MTHEQGPKPSRPRPAAEFGFSDKEQLYDRISHERLLEFLADEATQVHRIEESTNNYGEFLFVTLSRPGANRRIWVGFYGLGYHEYRERWLVDEWFWYQNNPLPEKLQQDISREEAIEKVQERSAELRRYAKQPPQTKQGRLFEMLADLTDEDGAYSEMQDLGDLTDWLFDDEE